MTIKERKQLWLASELDLEEEGMVIRPLPRRPRFYGNSRPRRDRLVLDPMTGKPVAECA